MTRRRTTAWIGLAACLMLLVVGPTASPAAAAQTASASWQERMLAQINVIRGKAGVRPLALCGNLTDAAQSYASLMARRNHYGHVGPDGSQPSDRMAAAGYLGNGVGENIAGGQATVREVMRQWRASPSHYAAITYPGFTRVGLGHASNLRSRYRTYWVQDFGFGGRC